MAESVGNLKFTSEREAQETLRHYGGENVSLHCDDNEILERCKNEPTHERRRPVESELEAIRFALLMQRMFKFSLKIVHCSTDDGLSAIVDARWNYPKTEVLVEATPHHIFTDETILTDKNRTLWQMHPPLRSGNDRLGVSQGLLMGDIDVLASDHAPHADYEKELVEENGKLVTEIEPDQKAVSGVPHLDTYGLFVIWLIKERRFPKRRIVEIASQTPGWWLNQFLPKTEKNGLGYGRIEKGYIGSLTVLDLETPTLVSRSMLKTKCGWSPFEGFTFPGRVAATIIRGQVYQH